MGNNIGVISKSFDKGGLCEVLDLWIYFKLSVYLFLNFVDNKFLLLDENLFILFATLKKRV